MQVVISSCVCVAEGSKSDSDDDTGRMFSTYSSSSAFDKISPSKKGNVSICAAVGATVPCHSCHTVTGEEFLKGTPVELPPS